MDMKLEPVGRPEQEWVFTSDEYIGGGDVRITIINESSRKDARKQLNKFLKLIGAKIKVE